MLKKLIQQSVVQLAICALFVSPALPALSTTADAQQTHIVAVNSERILRESAPAKHAQQKLEQEFAPRGRDLQKMQKRLESMSGELAKRGTKLAQPELEKKQRQLAQFDVDLQRQQRKFREDLNQRRNEELTAVLELANRAIKRIAEERHYDLIIQEAVYVNPRIDITDSVLEVLEKAEQPAATHP